MPDPKQTPNKPDLPDALQPEVAPVLGGSQPAAPHEQPDDTRTVEKPATLDTETDGVEVEASAFAETDSTAFDDDQTGKAIDDIVAKEGDEVLAAQDAAADRGGVKVSRRGTWLGRLWRNRWVRGLLLLGILGSIVTAATYPVSRYWVLNTAGVRVGVSVDIIDQTTEQPLKGIDVLLDGKRTKTDSQGHAKTTGLKLGQHNLVIRRNGFATIERSVVLGWGSNPLGTVGLKAVGTQYTVHVKDFISGKAVQGVEAVSGDAAAQSDATGAIVLTLPNGTAGTQVATLTKQGYRSEEVTLPEDPDQAVEVTMVTDRKLVYVSKQNGKYDLYKSDIDGQHKAVLLAGTGLETSNIGLAVSSDGTRAALVSTREDKRDSSGALLSTLTLITIETGERVTVGQALHIQLIDWIGPRLVFTLASSGTDVKALSYNVTDATRVQLTPAQAVGGISTAQGSVYFSVLAGDKPSDAQAGLYKIKADGTGKQTVLQQAVQDVQRTTYDTLTFQTADGSWHSYGITEGTVSAANEPTELGGRRYVDNTDRSRSAWINGGALTVYEVAAKKERVLQTASGNSYPLEWFGPAALLYQVTGSDMAYYIVAIDGGQPRKAVDNPVLTFGFGSLP